MVSLTISLTTSGLSASVYRKNPTPSSCSSQSLCSATPPPYQSQHQSQPISRDYPSHYYLRTPNTHHESVDALLPPARSSSSTSIPRRRDTTMSPPNDDSSNAQTSAIPIERRKSFGRGGAGNIRRPSVVPYATRTNEDGTPRRSSAWSISPGSSPEGRRASIMSWFGKKNPAADEGEDPSEAVKFKAVDLTGK